MKKWMMALCAAAILTACSKSPEELLSEQLKLGQKYLEELNYEAAIVAYKKAIELEPRAERAYLDLSWILVQQEEFDEAIEVLQEGLEMMPENENLLQILELLVPSVFCSADEGTYSEPVIVELKSRNKSEIYYSIDGGNEKVKDVLYREPIEFTEGGEYRLTYYAVSEYGTRGEIYEREIIVKMSQDEARIQKELQEYLYAVNNYELTDIRSAINYGEIKILDFDGEQQWIDHGDFYEVTNQTLYAANYYEWDEITQLKAGDTVTYSDWGNPNIYELASLVAEQEERYRIFETTDGEQIGFEDVFRNGKYVIVRFEEGKVDADYRGYAYYPSTSDALYCSRQKVYSGSFYLSKDCLVDISWMKYTNAGTKPMSGAYHPENVLEGIRDVDFTGRISGHITQIDQDGFIKRISQSTAG